MTAVVPDKVPVKVLAPLKVTLPAIVIVEEPLLIPVPPFADGNIPVTPVVKGKPVRLVAVPDVGVPSTGVTSVGLVASTGAPVPVAVTQAGTPELLVKSPALLAVAKLAITPHELPHNKSLTVTVVRPVPPFATGRAVPDKPTANVPLVVTGEPEIDKKLGTVIATDVTEPTD